MFILLFIIKFILPAGGPLYKLLTMKDFIKHQLRSSLQLITNVYIYIYIYKIKIYTHNITKIRTYKTIEDRLANLVICYN